MGPQPVLWIATIVVLLATSIGYFPALLRWIFWRELGWLEEVVGQKNGGLWGVSDEEDFYWIDDRNAYRYLRNEEVGIDERLRVAQSINWIFDGNRWRPMLDMELVHRGLERVILAMG